MTINVVLFEGVSAYALTSGFTSHSSFADTASFVIGSISSASFAFGGSGSFNGGFTGSFTGSFTGDGSGIVNTPSSSYAATASLLLGSVVSASFASTATSASYAATASFALNGGGGGGGFGGNFSGSFSGSISASAILVHGTQGISSSLVFPPSFTGSFSPSQPVISFYNSINSQGQVSASFPTALESDLLLYNGWADTAINNFLFTEISNQTVNSLYGLSLATTIDSASRVVNNYGLYIAAPITASVLSGSMYAIYVQDYQQSFLSNVTASAGLFKNNLTVLGSFVANSLLTLSPTTATFNNNTDALTNQTKIFRSEIGGAGVPALIAIADSGSTPITIPTNLFGVTLGGIGGLFAAGNAANIGRVQLGIFGYAEQSTVQNSSFNVAAGGYFLAQLSGSNTGNSWAGTMYGLRATANISASISSSGNVYGAYFDATGSANVGTTGSQQVTYGVFGTATGGDVNWAGWFEGSAFARGLVGSGDSESGNNPIWTVNGKAYGNLFFKADGPAGVVGVGGPWQSQSIPIISDFGAVGVVGAANQLSGLRQALGGYFYATQTAVNGVAPNTIIGAYGVAQPKSTATGFGNFAYGVSGLADVTTLSSLLNGGLVSVVGTRGQAKGISGSAAYGAYGTADNASGGVAYGGYFEATGAGTKFGLAVGSGSLVVSESVRVGGAVTASAFSGNGAAVTGVISSSYALTSSFAATGLSSSYAVTSSYASVAQTLLGSVVSASYALTASFASTALSASWAPGTPTTSASYANVATTVSPAKYVQLTGDTMTGNLVVSASILTSGSVSVNGDITSSGNIQAIGGQVIVGSPATTKVTLFADSGVLQLIGAAQIRMTGGGIKNDDASAGITINNYFQNDPTAFFSGSVVGIGTNTPNPGSNRGLDISGSLNVQAATKINGTTTVTGSVNVTGSISTFGIHSELPITLHESAISTPPSAHVNITAEDFHGFSRLAITDDTGVTLMATRDSVITVKNNSGLTVSESQAVYVNGASGNVPTIGLAIANTTSSMPAIGLMLETVTQGSFGRAMMFGVLDATNTSAYSAGDLLWVSDTVPGTLRNTPPSIPTNIVQFVGIVQVSGVGNGSISVRVTGANPISSSYAVTSSFATSASWAPGGSSVSASYASTASIVQPNIYVRLTGDTMTGNLIVSASTFHSGSVFVSGTVDITPQSASFTPLKIHGFTTQSADLTQWLNVSGTVLASVSASGLFAGSASYALNSLSGSFAQNSISSSYAQTLDSNATASYAATASIVAPAIYVLKAGDTMSGALNVNASLSGSNILVQGGATPFISFGSSSINMQYNSGNLIFTGFNSLRVAPIRPASSDTTGVVLQTLSGTQMMMLSGSQVLIGLGSAIFPNGDTRGLDISGSLRVQGSLAVTGSTTLVGTLSATGSLLGSSSYAMTASLLLGSITSASFASTATSASYAMTSSYGRGVRQTSTFSTPSIAPGQQYTGSVDMATEQWALLFISGSNNARVTLYTNSSSLASDLTRPITIQPSASAGIILDAVTTGSQGRRVGLAPAPIGYNAEFPTTTLTQITVTSQEATSASITFSFTYVSM